MPRLSVRDKKDVQPTTDMLLAKSIRGGAGSLDDSARSISCLNPLILLSKEERLRLKSTRQAARTYDESVLHSREAHRYYVIPL